MAIHYNSERCIGCQFCVYVCPRSCFVFDSERKKSKLVNPLSCLKCRACELNCEGDALRIEKPIFDNFFAQIIRI